MKIIKFIIIILGSSLFIPVSCSISVLGGIQVVAWIDSRDVQKGDSVHSLFSVVAVPQHSRNKNDFFVLSLQQIEQMRKVNEPLSFLMPISNSNMETAHSRYSYKILEDRGKEQTSDPDEVLWRMLKAPPKPHKSSSKNGGKEDASKPHRETGHDHEV